MIRNFIDEVKIYLKAGDGGNGCVSFLREKYIDKGGPNGGDGGSGASIILRSNGHINTLLDFRHKRKFYGKNGQNGMGSNKTGKSREPLIIEVPVGTQIFSENVLIHDFIKDDQEFEIARGGCGGLGNTRFKSATNQAPRKCTEGLEGEEIDIILKLKLLSDVGLIGLPNVGKSTFLSKNTNARPKIANYHFTTLRPQLGVVSIYDEEFVMADIPGLIKDAHLGSGLGDRFLKHIERCNLLVHIIDASGSDPLGDYHIIRNELESYSPLLHKKQEIICLNKIDVVEEEIMNEMISKLSNDTKKEIYPISCYANDGIDLLIKKIFDSISKNL